MTDHNGYSAEFSELLAKQIPVVNLPEKTFMDIAGYPHYENVISNILQFYFSPNEEHGLHYLFIDSLVKCINRKHTVEFNYTPGMCRVDREAPGLANTRIDLLIQIGDINKPSEKEAIIIECKIRAWLDNNLDHYWDAVAAKNKTGVILSLYKESNLAHAGFVNIVMEELVNEVLSRLENYTAEVSDRHLLFLNDFLSHLISLKNNPAMADYYHFYYEHAEKINELAQMRDNITRDIRNCVIRTGSELGYQTTGSAYHYRYWLIKGTSEIYFTFLVPDAYKTVDNHKLQIILEVQRKMIDQREKIINDPALRTIAKATGADIGELHNGGSYMYLLMQTIELNADTLINLSERIAEENIRFIKPVYERIKELI